MHHCSSSSCSFSSGTAPPPPPRHCHKTQRRPPQSSAPLLGPRAWSPLRTARMLFQWRRSLSGGWKAVSVAQTTRHPCILAGKHGHASQAGGQKNKSLVTPPPATSANRNKESSFPRAVSSRRSSRGGNVRGRPGRRGRVRATWRTKGVRILSQTKQILSCHTHSTPSPLSEPAGAPPFGNQVLSVPLGPSGRLRWGGFGACGPLPPGAPSSAAGAPLAAPSGAARPQQAPAHCLAGCDLHCAGPAW